MPGGAVPGGAMPGSGFPRADAGFSAPEPRRQAPRAEPPRFESGARAEPPRFEPGARAEPPRFEPGGRAEPPPPEPQRGAPPRANERWERERWEAQPRQPDPREAEPPPPREPVTAPAPGPSFGTAAPPVDVGEYEPANSTEEDLLESSRSGNTDQFLSTLLLAKLLVPGYAPDPAQWPVEEINGLRYLVTFTSPQRLTERQGAIATASTVKFTALIVRWPDDQLGFAVNPGTPVGATLSGVEVRTLASWAAEVGLIDGRDDEPEPAKPAAPTPASRPAARPAPEPTPSQPLMMQRTIAAAQVPLYLERGYDRVSGFVQRSTEVAHLRTPDELYRALGLASPGSPFQFGDAEVYAMRWPAHCPSLYRIPFGGQTEAGMQAMQGWVIERAPFRGNGFAPSETSDVIAEFKVDSTRLPHGAQLWRLTRAGDEALVALFDADAARWRQIGSAD
jgi:hypothetical protein